MSSETFKQIFEHLEKQNHKESKTINLAGRTLPIDSKFFFNTFTQTQQKIAFVDGGNGELAKAPNFSLQFVRIYASIFKNNQRIHQEKQEFYVAVVADRKEDRIVYTTQTFDTQFDIKHSFDINDSTLSTSNHSVSPSTIAEAVRKFAEIKLAAKIMAHLENGDLLVRDGELNAQITFEEKYLKELLDEAVKKNISVCGFSKTTTLLTDAGNSAVAALSAINDSGTWYYLPEQAAEPKTAFVKLSPLAKHVFRTDFFNLQKTGEIMFLLSENAKDPSFLGYPYGLVDADLRARVSRQECAALSLQFMTQFGENFKHQISALNAHEILNTIH